MVVKVKCLLGTTDCLKINKKMIEEVEQLAISDYQI